jgi:hypothetical protein
MAKEIELTNGMQAKDYLKKIGITDRVLNREDLPEYWKSISQLMEEYAALRQPHVVRQSEQLPDNESKCCGRCIDGLDTCIYGTEEH